MATLPSQPRPVPLVGVTRALCFSLLARIPNCKNHTNSIQVLSEEITSATASTEYLSQKRAWGEDRLGVARLLSLFSPAGHSLVSWAAACGQTEVVEILMDHGATAELGDETRAVSASIIQVSQGRSAALLRFFAVAKDELLGR